MTSIVRNTLIGTSSLVALGSVGYLANWTLANSSLVPPERKGNFLERMTEVFLAFYQKKHIKDPHTSLKHIETVANLSANDFDLGDRMLAELEKVNRLHFSGYLQAVLQDNPGMTLPVFEYVENFDIRFPIFSEKTGFVFSGPLYDLYHSKSREDILQGNYIRCSSQMRLKPGVAKSKNFSAIQRSEDVLITGATDRWVCGKLKNTHLRDAAIFASNNLSDGMDEDDPISDTPVFECTEDGCSQVGDLYSLPESAKERIRWNDFVACNFFALNKTRLSNGDYKECGAIVAGISDKSVCSDLHFGHMRKMLEKYKKQNSGVPQ